jgi:hypothetical protein
VDLSGLRWRTVAGPCKHDNKTPVSTKGAAGLSSSMALHFSKKNLCDIQVFNLANLN